MLVLGVICYCSSESSILFFYIFHFFLRSYFFLLFLFICLYLCFFPCFPLSVFSSFERKNILVARKLDFVGPKIFYTTAFLHFSLLSFKFLCFFCSFYLSVFVFQSMLSFIGVSFFSSLLHILPTSFPFFLVLAFLSSLFSTSSVAVLHFQ